MGRNGGESRAGEALCSLPWVSLGEEKLSFELVAGSKPSAGRLAETKRERSDRLSELEYISNGD